MFHTSFTYAHMLAFAAEAWGDLGLAAVRSWAELNERFFAGGLRPIPLVITNTQPFGSRIAFCSHGSGRTITLNIPAQHRELVADNGSLLHEMIHQALAEAGEHPGHASEGWRREIMRLHQAITGKALWAGRSMTKRTEGADGKRSKVVRVNEPHADGTPSLTQMQIATWPRSVGIALGALGAPLAR